MNVVYTIAGILWVGIPIFLVGYNVWVEIKLAKLEKIEREMALEEEKKREARINLALEGGFTPCEVCGGAKKVGRQPKYDRQNPENKWFYWIACDNCYKSGVFVYPKEGEQAWEEQENRRKIYQK